MNRSALLLLAVIVAITAATGCASLGGRRDVRVPGSERLFVSVFVDESERGEVGVALAEAIQIELYQRDPQTLAMQFEEGAVAVDGTVTAVEEVPLQGGKRELRVRIRAILVDKSGRTVTDLGTVESRASYRADGDAQATAAEREDALRRAIETLARHVITEIDHRGRDGATRTADTTTAGLSSCSSCPRWST